MIFAVNRLFRVESFTALSRNNTSQLMDARTTHCQGCSTPANWKQRLRLAVRQAIAPILTLNLLAILLFCPIIVNASPPAIRYAHPTQLVLSTLKNENGERNNPLLRVAKALAQHAELDFESISYPAARLFHSIDKGYANFSILVHSPSLDKCCLVGKSPVVTTELRIYHKKETPKITSVESLAGKRVITIRGYSYGQLKPFLSDADNNIAVALTLTHASAFAMLDQGRADYVLDYKQPSIEVLQQRPIEDIQFEILHKISLYLILHKSYPNAPQVLAEFEKILKIMDVASVLDLPSDTMLADK